MPEELLRDPDIEMYIVKKDGGYRHTNYNADMDAGAAASLQLQTDLRHALARSEFILDYQPIYNATSNQVTVVEALIRWEHPTRGTAGI